MNWLRTTLLRKFAHVKDEAQAAIANSNALKAEVEATEGAVDAQHQDALAKLEQAEQRSKKLRAMDAQNHYSEGLTYSMRGRPAS